MNSFHSIQSCFIKLDQHDLFWSKQKGPLHHIVKMPCNLADSYHQLHDIS